MIMIVMNQGGRNKGKLDGRKKDMKKKATDVANLKAKVDEMVKNKDLAEAQKLSLVKKRHQEKEARWLQIQEDAKRTEIFDERKLNIEEERVKVEILERK